MNIGFEMFLLAAEEMNFSKAAERAFVTQQCLSDHIKRLEETYHVTLFKRRPHLELTPEGQAMRRYLGKIQFLENSMKYAGTRPVEIEISVFATETEVVLEWNDHGNGVPEDKLPHIFERFYRCDEARKEKGSGVGLYVVNYIMEQHHGRVEAENDGGFKIRLLFPKED